jgi:integrase
MLRGNGAGYTFLLGKGKLSRQVNGRFLSTCGLKSQICAIWRGISFMSKRKSLVYQFVERLKSMACYGKSRNEAKTEKFAQIKSSDVKGWQPIIIDGIYSYETMRSYTKECVSFAVWVRENFAVRDIEVAKTHVNSYLEHRMSKGDSAWTLKLIRSALRKVYGDSNLASNVNLPDRKKEQIIRSRGQKAMDKKFSVERNRDLVDFCKATGLRRHELKAVKIKDIYRDEDGKLRVEVNQGKGGRPRSIPVIESLESRVLEIISGKDLESKVIEKIPVRADIHGYRRDYAANYYKKLSGKDFNFEGKDTFAMQQVSWALGHNRLDVVTRNYLE